ncbi:pentapeptide repeat-containing protein [Sodalis praecaptivus]|nr:pentapeptide repeat-containing protein [Sodalis praecaptivus]
MILPRRLNLTGANLRKSEFNRVTMTAVLLCQSDLSHANLASCNLRRAKLRHASLYRARLDKALLRRADLQHADLNQAQLNYAVLDFAKLRNANFKLTSFYRAKLRHVDLSDAYLKKVDLSGACLRYANLRNADLRTTHFRGTCLRNANLSGAHISPGGMCNMNFQGAIIEGDLKLDLSAGWSQNAVDNYLNPSNYAKGGGVLQAIDSISTVYQPLKITLMRRIMVSLQQTDLSLTTVAPALLDKLSSAPYYDEPDIARWLQEIGSRFISIFDTKIMRRQHEEVLRVILDTFSRYPESMVIHSVAFIQTIAQAIFARRASATVQQAKTLYARYLTHRRIAPYALKAEFGDRAKHVPNWQDKSAANYVLLAGKRSAYALLLSQEGLESLLGSDHRAADGRHDYLYRDGVPVNRQEYCWETLRQERFPLFQSGYLRRLSEKHIIEVLARLNLSAATQQLFVETTKQAYSNIKLVSPEKQLLMHGLWANRVYRFDSDGNCTLDEGFYARLMQLALLVDRSPAERGQVMFCLAALFAKCASNSLFGTEEDSPYALRSLACAFLDRACTLQSRIAHAARDFTVWKNALLGRQGEATCAAVVASEMLGYGTTHFPEVLKQVMPVEWR